MVEREIERGAFGCVGMFGACVCGGDYMCGECEGVNGEYWCLGAYVRRAWAVVGMFGAFMRESLIFGVCV